MKRCGILAAILSLFLFAFSAVWAGPVTSHQARAIAEDFYRQQAGTLSSGKTGNFTLVYPVPAKGKKSVASAGCYVFNVGDNRGFVIVSGDDDLRNILGYSLKGRFEAENMPENLVAWLDWYEYQVAAYQAGVSRGNKAAVDPVCSLNRAAVPIVEPLLESHPDGSISYDQGWPYNNLCPNPEDRNAPTYTGCVATALASIARYYEYPLRGEGYVSYETSGNGWPLSLDISQSVYDWDNMLCHYEYGGSYTEQQQNAVATLMRDIGYAIEMNYGYDASGANGYNAMKGMITNLGYTKRVQGNERIYYTDKEWHDLLRTELEAGRPVYYSGAPEDGSMGHAFVCDGYNDESYYHFNWGWSGLADGWYSVDRLAPTDLGTGAGYGDYSFFQMIITNLVPAQENEYPYVQINFGDNGDLECGFSAVEGTYSKTTLLEPVARCFYNYSCVPVRIDIAVGFEKGGVLEAVSLQGEDYELEVFYGWNEYPFKVYPADLPQENGTYRMSVYVRNADDPDAGWEKVRAPKDRIDTWNVTVSDDSYTIGRYEEGGDETMLQGVLALRGAVADQTTVYRFIGPFQVMAVDEVRNQYYVAEDGGLAVMLDNSAGILATDVTEGMILDEFSGTLRMENGYFSVVPTGLRKNPVGLATDVFSRTDRRELPGGGKGSGLPEKTVRRCAVGSEHTGSEAVFPVKKDALTVTLDELGRWTGSASGSEKEAGAKDAFYVAPIDADLPMVLLNDAYWQSSLLRIENVKVEESGVFGSGSVYTLTQDGETFPLKVYFENADYIGEPIPEREITVEGILTFSDGRYYLTPRSQRDFSDFLYPVRGAYAEKRPDGNMRISWDKPGFMAKPLSRIDPQAEYIWYTTKYYRDSLRIRQYYPAEELQTWQADRLHVAYFRFGVRVQADYTLRIIQGEKELYRKTLFAEDLPLSSSDPENHAIGEIPIDRKLTIDPEQDLLVELKIGSSGELAYPAVMTDIIDGNHRADMWSADGEDFEDAGANADGGRIGLNLYAQFGVYDSTVSVVAQEGCYAVYRYDFASTAGEMVGKTEDLTECSMIDPGFVLLDAGEYLYSVVQEKKDAGSMSVSEQVYTPIVEKDMEIEGTIAVKVPFGTAEGARVRVWESRLSRLVADRIMDATGKLSLTLRRNAVYGVTVEQEHMEYYVSATHDFAASPVLTIELSEAKSVPQITMAREDGSTAVLHWRINEIEWTDNMESYEVGTVDTIGEWFVTGPILPRMTEFYDTIGDRIEIPHADEPQRFMVTEGDKLSPGYAGGKVLASFAALDFTSQSDIVFREIERGGGMFKMRTAGRRDIRFIYGKGESDGLAYVFDPLVAGPDPDSGDGWHEVKVFVPEDARSVGFIHAPLKGDGLPLLVDDLSYGPVSAMPRSYEIYVDGKKRIDVASSVDSCVLTGLPGGLHEVFVRAVYADGYIDSEPDTVRTEGEWMPVAGLRADVDRDKAVLHWHPGEYSRPIGYNVWLGDEPEVRNLPDTMYVLQNLSPGKYTAFVSAVYDGGESEKEEVVFDIPETIHNEGRQAWKVTVVPNPSSGSFRVETEESCRMRMTDLTGREVLMKDLSEAGVHFVEAGYLPSGVYLLKLTGKRGETHLRVVIR